MILLVLHYSFLKENYYKRILPTSVRFSRKFNWTKYVGQEIKSILSYYIMESSTASIWICVKLTPSHFLHHSRHTCHWMGWVAKRTTVCWASYHDIFKPAMAIYVKISHFISIKTLVYSIVLQDLTVAYVLFHATVICTTT